MPIQFTSKDFVLANTSDLFIAPLTSTQVTPATATITVAAGGAALGATTVPVSALGAGIKYYEGQRFNLGSPATKQIVLAADTAVNATSITVKPLAVALVAADALTSYVGLLPVYSVNSLTTSRDEATVDGRNFKSGDWASQAITMRSWSMSCSGNMTKTDPAYALLAARANLTGLGARVFLQFQEPEGVGEQGVAYVSGLERARENDAFVQLSWSFLGDGALTDIAADLV